MGQQVMTPPAPVGDLVPVMGTGNPRRSLPTAHWEGSTFVGKCEPAPKSCQALGPEVRNSNGEGGGGTLRTSRKPKDQGVQGRKRATVKQGPGVPSLGVGALTGSLPPWGGANLLSPRTAGVPECMSTAPTSIGQGSCWHCPLQAQRITRVVWLGL